MTLRKRQPRSVCVLVAAPSAAGWRYLALLRQPRPDLGLDAFWQPITGGVEDDDTDEQTARRELAEEAGFSHYLLSRVDFVHRFAVEPSWAHLYESGTAEIVQSTFVAVLDAPAVPRLSEHSAHEWLPLAEARARFAYEGNRQALDHAARQLEAGLRADWLVSPRLVLRRYRESDLDEIFTWAQNKETTKWMGPRYRAGRSREDIATSLAPLVAGTSEGEFFVISNDTGDYLGGIDLTSINRTDRNAVLSIVIAKSGHRNQGWGGEALRLLARYAFGTLGLHKITLTVAAENHGAVRCYEKVGFVVEGRQKEQLRIDGRYSDLLTMALFEPTY